MNGLKKNQIVSCGCYDRHGNWHHRHYGRVVSLPLKNRKEYVIRMDDGHLEVWSRFQLHRTSKHYMDTNRLGRTKSILDGTLSGKKTYKNNSKKDVVVYYQQLKTIVE